VEPAGELLRPADLEAELVGERVRARRGRERPGEVDVAGDRRLALEQIATASRVQRREKRVAGIAGGEEMPEEADGPDEVALARVVRPDEQVEPPEREVVHVDVAVPPGREPLEHAANLVCGPTASQAGVALALPRHARSGAAGAGPRRTSPS